MSPQKYYLVCRIASSTCLIAQGLYYAFTQPGPMDIISGAIVGLTLYVIWFNRERTT